jgi:hypothetical protein
MSPFHFLTLSTLLITPLFATQEYIEPQGIDQIKTIIASDTRLQTRTTATQRMMATTAADGMNALIKEAIIAEGLANDGVISNSDARTINRYILTNHKQTWRDLRGDKSSRTGYYAVQIRKRGATTIVMGKNAVNDLWANIYAIGFEPLNKNRLTNGYGGKGPRFSTLGYYLNETLQDDIATGTLTNPDFKEVVGTTQTNLDSIITAIISDQGLLQRISTDNIRDGARAADELNKLVIEAIMVEGLGNDGRLSTADIRQINTYLVNNHLNTWSQLHGDDERGEETGFHLVQNDGAYARMFADNVVNTVADGIYHLGFKTNRKNRLLNEDGNKNQRFEKVAWWLDTILKEDLQAGKLTNPNYQEVVGTTGTTFDKIIPFIYNNEGLLLKVSMADIRAGAHAANEMNELLVEAIKNTGIAKDNHFSVDDIRTLNNYLYTNHATEWAELHGDDEQGEETGYHRIQNDGAIGIANNKNVINTLADGIYHLGFYTPYKHRLANEDGNKNVSFRNVAYWLNKYLQEDFSKGTLIN